MPRLVHSVDRNQGKYYSWRNRVVDVSRMCGWSESGMPWSPQPVSPCHVIWVLERTCVTRELRVVSGLQDDHFPFQAKLCRMLFA